MLGLKVFREPNQRGFNQPCPLWQGQCTIYDMPEHPRFCHTYKCELLKKLLGENIPLRSALTIVQQTMDMIHDLEHLLPGSTTISFRERLVACMENNMSDPDLWLKAETLIDVFEKQFGVKDFFD